MQQTVVAQVLAQFFPSFGMERGLPYVLRYFPQLGGVAVYGVFFHQHIGQHVKAIIEKQFIRFIGTVQDKGVPLPALAAKV
jgi:hypothetical protein